MRNPFGMKVLQTVNEREKGVRNLFLFKVEFAGGMKAFTRLKVERSDAFLIEKTSGY
jgi:hypothetical protein